MNKVKKSRKQLHIELRELQEAYNIAMKEINELRAKRQYWENKYKRLEEKNVKIKNI